MVSIERKNIGRKIYLLEYSIKDVMCFNMFLIFYQFWCSNLKSLELILGLGNSVLIIFILDLDSSN